jgi:DNA-binding LacI/PurR family transcriptional regulator
MARPKTNKVINAKQKLIARLQDGLHRSGDRFFSNRAIADQFGVSYQTADRIVRELVKEGHLTRRRASGTYVAGRRSGYVGVQLIFDSRAQREGSFGARLLKLLRLRLRREGVDLSVAFCREDQSVKITSGRYPVLWESPATLANISHSGASALLLNHRAPPGLASLRVDSVAVDDYLGGACAAQLLKKRAPGRLPAMVIAGPRGDVRSDQRVSGFLAIATARVIHADSWYVEGAAAAARVVLEAKPAGVFACNDRLAQAVIIEASHRGISPPPLVGFDDAPIAEELHLTTIAIPWRELIDAASAVISRRLGQHAGTASHTLLAPRPIVRLT